MNDKVKQKKGSSFEPNITFSGAGVLHVNSAELVKTQQAKKQIEALGKLKEKMSLLSI